jgi:alkylation response protein AidB-like acyl-CoA dehydrogenase
MNFDYSSKTQEWIARVKAFLAKHGYPNEARYYRELEACGVWDTPQVVEELKPLAKNEGLWNLFLPASEFGAGLSNLEYAPLAEQMGLLPWASEIFNCSALTPATWKCWRVTAPTSRRSNGWCRCSTARFAPASP